MASKNKRIVLIDAHAIIHRAYHALPDFSSSKGKPTGALYGLSAMLIKIIQDLKPDYIAACYDLPDPTHRHEVFEEYKAGRAKTDDNLIAQLENSKDIFHAFSIPIYEMTGFEADDILGTIVDKTKDIEDLEIVIASGDLDTLQLISGKKVQVYTLKKGISDTILYNEEKVKERYGFGPELVADYKGLRGDPSDNIPGVKGVGEKTATELILAFGEVENIYKELKKDEEKFQENGFKPRVVKLLKEGEDDAFFSKMLATIRLDAPINFSVPTVMWSDSVELSKVYSLFDELEFRTLAERVKKAFGEESDEEDVAKESDEGSEEVKTVDFKEVSLALWLLHSDVTEPKLDDILRFSGEDDFEKAKVKIFKELKKTGKLNEVFEKIEKPLVSVVAAMKETGILLDTKYLSAISKKYHTELEKIRGRIFKHAGHEFNVNSPKQLGNVLYDEMGLKTDRQKKTETGQRSTRESELEKMRDQHEIIGDTLKYRELQKLLSTYIDNLPELVEKDGRLHADFLQAGTTTGRMSSQNPNLQNIPIRTEYGRKMRNAFVADKGHSLVALDYSQIELRVAAALSGDEKLINVFKKGGDVHTAVASEVFGVPADMVDSEMRRRAKVINFGILYGMGVNALRANLGDEVNRNDAQKFLSEYFKNFSGLAHYIERVKIDAAHNGYTETLFGRRRYFAGFESSLPYVRAQAERMAINAPIQGTQADIIKLAMVKIHDELQKKKKLKDVKLLLQVHDELVYEIRKSEAEKIAKEIKKTMESIVSKEDFQGVPLIIDVSIGPNWGEMKKI
jgi:DNA polymerase I